MQSTSASSFFFDVRCNFLNSSGAGVVFNDGAAGNFRAQLSATIDTSDNSLVVHLGDGPELGRTPRNSCSPNGWAYLEIVATIAANNGGNLTVRINGNTQLVLSNITTQNSNASTNQVTEYQFTSGGGYCGVAHICLCDPTGPAPWNTFLDDVRVQTLLPTANDAVQFIPNGNSANWQNAAAVPPNPGADFNSDATVGDQDTFACAQMAAGLGRSTALPRKRCWPRVTPGTARWHRC